MIAWLSWRKDCKASLLRRINKHPIVPMQPTSTEALINRHLKVTEHLLSSPIIEISNSRTLATKKIVFKEMCLILKFPNQKDFPLNKPIIVTPRLVITKIALFHKHIKTRFYLPQRRSSLLSRIGIIYIRLNHAINKNILKPPQLIEKTSNFSRKKEKCNRELKKWKNRWRVCWTKSHKLSKC